jgi:hypothetical protein
VSQYRQVLGYIAFGLGHQPLCDMHLKIYLGEREFTVFRDNYLTNKLDGWLKVSQVLRESPLRLFSEIAQPLLWLGKPGRRGGWDMA